MLHCKKRACAAKTGLNFIGDQQNAVLIADRTQPLDERGRWDNVATLALHWFDQNRRDILGHSLGL